MSIFSTPLGGEFFVNTTTADFQWDPSLTNLSDGSVAVGWGSVGSGPRAAYFQRYTVDGVPIGTETSVTSTVGTSPDSPVVIARPVGFTVLYEYFTDTYNQSIAARNFGPDGTATGTSFGFRTGTYGHNNTLDVAALPDGGSIVSWSDRSAGSTETYLRRFDSNFLATGSDVQLDFPTADFESNVSAAGLPNGIYAATWVGTNVDGLEDAVYLRIFNMAGEARTPYITVQQEGGVRSPEIAALADGTFVVVTESRDSGILAYRYGVNGALIGTPTPVNTSPTDFNNAIRVAALPDGGFVVVWSDTENNQGHILGRAFDAQGRANGGEMRLNTSGVENQTPDVLVLANGTVMVAWQGSDADESGITARLFGVVSSPTQGPDALDGTAGNDTINGLGGNDTIRGFAGDDRLNGGNGHDILQGGPGDDRVLGDDGNDRLYLGAGSDFGGGGAGNDLIVDGAGSNTIYGGLGSDTVQGGTGADTIYGGGNSGTNRLFGNGGSDLIYTGDGGDFVGAGAGNDIVRGGAGSDSLYGGLGNDNIGGGAGNDLIHGSAGHNTIYGGAGSDTVQGGAGRDLIDGGGNGFNRLFGNGGHDSVTGGTGNDMIAGGTGNDMLYGTAGNDTIYAGLGNDFIGGGADDDLIFAGAGNNLIYGGTGNDRINAGAGHDIMTGGPGIDVFVFVSAAHVGIGAGRDIVTDFTSGTDKIDLSALGSQFNGTSGLSGNGVPSFTYFPPNGLLIGDTDGNGTADWVLELSGAPSVAASDFIL